MLQNALFDQFCPLQKTRRPGTNDKTETIFGLVDSSSFLLTCFRIRDAAKADLVTLKESVSPHPHNRAASDNADFPASFQPFARFPVNQRAGESPGFGDIGYMVCRQSPQ
jgi:hypothetical protein